MKQGILSKLSRLNGSVVAILAAVVVWLLPERWGPLDEAGERFVNRALLEAMAVYGMARVVNKMVSVPQDGAPMGTGQILDPINDATERLAEQASISVMILTAMKMVSIVLVPVATKLLALALLIVALYLPLSPGGVVRRGLQYTTSALIAVVVFRVSLPLAGSIDSILMEKYFSPQIRKEMEPLEPIREKWKEVKEKVMSEWKSGSSSGSWWKKAWEKTKGMVSSLTSAMTEGIPALFDTMVYLVGHADETVRALVNLMALLFALVVIEVFVIPIAIFLFLRGLVNSMLKPAEPVAVVEGASPQRNVT